MDKIDVIQVIAERVLDARIEKLAGTDDIKRIEDQ